jgi:hypothetical protein
LSFFLEFFLQFFFQFSSTEAPMNRFLTVGSGLVLAAMSVPALADLTIRQEAFEDPDHGVLRETLYIKGDKLRLDIVGHDGQSSQIIDLGTGKHIVLIPMIREAWVDTLARVDRAATPPRIEVRRTGELQQIAGRSAQVHEVTVRLHGTEGDMWRELKARVAIVADSPGAAEYQSFFVAAPEYSASLRGAEYADGKGNPYDPSSNVRAIAELYRAIAETGGVAYEVVTQFRWAGTSPMVARFNKNPENPHRSTVKSVSTQPLSDALFTVPKGYAESSAAARFSR